MERFIDIGNLGAEAALIVMFAFMLRYLLTQTIPKIQQTFTEALDRIQKDNQQALERIYQEMNHLTDALTDLKNAIERSGSGNLKSG